MKIKELYQKNENITVENYLNKCGVKDLEDFFNPSGKHLDDFHNYNNIADGVQMFKYHYLMNDGAYILCDSGDTDGITSTTIMYQYMKALNEDWDIEILLHSGKQRGLKDEELFHKVLDNPKGLLIIPDSGTNDLYEVEELYKKTKTDVLVLDHHEFKSPIQKGVLINNQDEKSNVSKNGSGCLVTHKFLEALDCEFDKSWSSWFIDMVALSLVSDSMNMSDEQNRTYYHYGLETIDCVNNEFLKHLIDHFIGNKSYSQRDISFKIIPKINSICRSKNQELKQRIILAFLGYDDYDEVLDLCLESHKNQIETVNNIIELNLGKIKEITDNNLIVFSCDDMPKSYSGLIAGKIMGMCNGKPTIVGKVIDNQFIGSLRSPIPLRKDLDENELVDWANGHEDSCGISIPSENLQKLVDYYNGIKMSYEPCTTVLSSCHIDFVTNNLFRIFNDDMKMLWGHGIEEPKFHFKLEYIPIDINVMGKGQTTLKIKKNGIDIMFFFVNTDNKNKLGLYCEEAEVIQEDGSTKVVKSWLPNDDKKRCLEIIGTLGVNVWKNKVTNQIIVDKFEVKPYKEKTVKSVFKC